MKYTYIVFIVGVILLSMSSCSKEDMTRSKDQDYLIFGHFYGFCKGESCIEIYKVDQHGLWEDLNDNYPVRDNYYSSNFTPLPTSLHKQVKDLVADFPDSLWMENQKVLGMPDAGDWGGFYVEYKKKGVKKFWIVDKMLRNVPEYLHPFLNRIDEKITIINKQ